MADDNDEIIVSLPGSTDGVTITDPKDVKVAKTAAHADDDPLNDLKGQFANMQSRLTATQATAGQTARELADTKQRLAAAEEQVIGSQMDTVETGLSAAKAEADSAEAAYVTATEAGDFLAAARAQRRMASAEARVLRFTEAKDDLEDATKRRPAADKTPHQRAAPTHTDPVEEFTKQMSPRSAAWIKAHPDCVTDPKKNARMLAAHNLAMADDIPVDTDEYFQRIEAGIGAAPAAKVEKKTGDGTRPSSAAASAAGAQGPLNGGIDVRLTRGEATSATDGTLVWNYDDPSGKNLFKKGDPIGLAEMARRKHEGMKAGLYDRAVT